MFRKVKRIFKDHRQAGAFHEVVPIQAAVDDYTFAATDGTLLSVLKLGGLDSECLDGPERENATARVTKALRTLSPDFRLYQLFLKDPHEPMPRGDSENPVVREATENRADYLDGRNLYREETYWIVAYEGYRKILDGRRDWREFVNRLLRSALPFLSAKSNIDRLEGTLDKARNELANKTSRLVLELSDVVKPELLAAADAFKVLYRLLNYSPQQIGRSKMRYKQFVDFQLVDSPLECHRDHLRLGDHYVQVLTLKEPPSQTQAHMLRNLQMTSGTFVLVSEWRRASNAAIRRVIRSKQRHFHNSKKSLTNYLPTAQPNSGDSLEDQSAVRLVGDLGASLASVELDGRCFGEYSLTIVVRDTERAKLARSVAEVIKACAVADITVIEERYNALNAFLATLPGNSAFNLRRLWLLDTNHADLSFLFSSYAGEERNKVLGTDHLAVFETNHHTPYFFNLHFDDIAHLFVCGGTGSGKSFTLNFLLTHLQKYNPFTFICDLGASYRGLTRLCGGTYVPVSLENSSFTINPFSLPPTEENVRFLLAFVRVLIESGGYRINAQEERDLYEQIKNLYEIEPSQRRLLTLSNILGRNLREQLGRWTVNGPYGKLFDNAEDNLTFARFQTFDFEGMDKLPQLLEPLLFYILHRANAVIYDPSNATTFKVFVVDEAWRLLRHPAIRGYIQEGLKTWRKKNAAMIMATQSGNDLLQSEMLSVVVESCSTKLFLANPSIDMQAYRDAFHLNETEAHLVANLVSKQQILIKRPDRSKVVNLHVDRKGYWLYTNNPFDNQKKDEAFAQYGFEQGLEILARSNS